MRSKKLLSWLIVFGLGSIGTVQYHLPQFLSRFDTFFGDRGDLRGFLFFCEHWYQALQGKVDLLSPGIFYPAKGTLAYSDLLLGFAIPFSFFRTLGFSMFSSLEIVIIVLTFLTYFTCFVLLNRVLRFSLLPSCAGAMFFGFSSPKFFQLIHLQLQFVICLPLIFIFVIMAVQQATTPSQTRVFILLSLAGLALNIQLLTAFYMGWFFCLWCFLFLFLTFLIRRSREFLVAFVQKFWPALLASAATFLIGATPFILTYLPVANESNWYTYDNVQQMIPRWWSFLSMGDGNYLWGWLSGLVRPKPVPVYWGELTVGVGVITSLVWIAVTFLAVWIVMKNFHSHSHTGDKEQIATSEITILFLGLMILATALFYSLGVQYGNGYSLWQFVYSFFPGAKAIRAMSRYVIFLTLPMSIGFAFALDYGIKRIRVQRTIHAKTTLIIVLFLLTSFIVVEQFGFPRVSGTGFSKGAETAYLTAMVSKLPNDCTAFYVVAAANDHHSAAEYQYDAMLVAVMKHIPTLNASMSQFPPGWFGLYHVKDPVYEQNVKEWIALNKLNGKICRLELSPPPEAFDSP